MINAVRDARYDRRTDEPDSGLTVGEARRNIEAANQNWAKVSAAFEAALDATLRERPEEASEIQLARTALSQLQLSFSTEMALVQALDAQDENLKLANIPAWPTEGRAVLEEAAFGSPGTEATSLMSLIRVGTDDDPAPEPAGQLYGDAVGHAIRVIRRQAAESINSVLVGLAAVPLMDWIPLPTGTEAGKLVRDLLDEPASWAVEEVTKQLPRGISKWSRWALGKATQLLKKVLGKQRFEALDRLLAKGAATTGTDLLADALVWVYDTGDVIQRGEAAFDPPGKPLKVQERRKRGDRLSKLEKSNKRWLTPIKVLSPGVGHLWSVPIPLGPVAIPAAPAAAAVLLAWALVLSGDQLDTRYPYPNFWKGVVRRAQGE
ncbi:hypothetical protein [Mycobacterium sp. MMS18-G62]